MTKTRLEAFSDGVLAIVITIMVLELKAPHEATWEALGPLTPIFLSYVLSFLYVGIYWNNHHHLFHAVQKVNGAILWANLHLLFWLSLFPFVTAWLGENHFGSVPAAAYGLVLFMAAIAYFILAHVLIRHHGKESILARAMGKDFKGMISVVLYVLGISLAFVETKIALAIYTAVALMWVIPDRRIEKNLER